MNRLHLIKQAAKRVQESNQKDPITSFELKQIVEKDYCKVSQKSDMVAPLNFE